MKESGGLWPSHTMVLGMAVCLLASVAVADPIGLTNGVPVSDISGQARSEQHYAIVVPEGQTELLVRISGGTGDCDLYLRKDAAPTTIAYDYRPFKVGSDESVTVTSPAGGTWYIMLRGFADYSALTLEAIYSLNVMAIPLTNGVIQTGLAGVADSERFYQIEVPLGRSKLEISISGGTGDCDLYVRKDALPTTEVYDYRPFLLGNDESVVINDPAAGMWYVLLKGYRDYADLSLLALSIRPSSGEPAHSAITVAGDGELIIDGYVSHYWPMDANIATGLWPDIVAEGPAGGKKASLSTMHEMVWTTFDYATDPQATVTANFTIDMDLFGGDTDSWASAEYWVKLELVGQYGTLIDSNEVRSGSIKVINGADLSQSKAVSLSVTTPPDLVDFTNCAVLRLTAGATAEALTVSLSEEKPDDETIMLANGVTIGGLAGAAASETYFQIEVPAGQAKLQISTSGGTGDVDLYVRKNAKPTTTKWDFRPHLIGNDETVAVNKPAAGTYYILLKASKKYSGTTLRAFYGDVKP